ncbi:bifunctional diguanylate cyclase/phosphodiesterase [Hydrogenophaga soli]
MTIKTRTRWEDMSELEQAVAQQLTRLRWRLCGWVGLCACALALLATLGLDISKASYRQVAETDSASAARMLETSITLTVRGVELGMRSMAADLAACAGDRKGCVPDFRWTLSEHGRHFPEANAFYFMMPDGHLRHAFSLSTGYQEVDVDVTDRDYVLKALSGAVELAVSGPQVGRISGRWSINLARRVVDVNGHLLGVLVASVDLEQLERLLAQVPVGQQGAVSLRDEQMGVILRLPEKEGIGKAVGVRNISPQLQALLDEGRTVGTYRAVTPIDGVERTVSFVRSQRYPLYVNVGLSEFDYLADWRQERRLVWGTVLALCVALGAAAWVYWGRRKSLVVAQVQADQAQRALRKEYDKTAAILKHASDGIHILDRRGHLVEANDRFCEMLGYSRIELLGVHFSLWEERLPPANWQQRLAMNGSEVFETQHRTRSGQLLEVEVSLNRFDMGGEPYTVASSRDVTERKRAQRQQQLAASVFSHAHEGIVITDPDGVIIDVNESFTRITGYTRDDALGQNPRMLQSSLHPPEYHAAMWSDITAHGRWYGEVWNRRKDGQVYAEMLSINAVTDAQGKLQCYVGLFSDITSIKEHQQRLEHIAHYDPLTDLPNRVLLNDRLNRAMARCQRHEQSMAVVYLDLDGFKQVNDQHGHEVGDQLLVALGRKMAASLREGDTLARVGGDEFVAVLTDLGAHADFTQVLQRLLDAASAPIAVGPLTLQVSASIGVTVYPQDASEPEQLLRHADQAMYQAKQDGRNRFHLFDLAQDSAARTVRQWVDAVKQGLARDEFVLHYQPKVNMRTGEVVGVEALIRWLHPVEGLLSPGVFIPLVEDDLVAVDLGEWVIRTALAQAAEWAAQGLHLPVSVNVGGRQLQQPDFLERLQALLQTQPQLPSHYLEMEILETSALEDTAHVRRVILGCQDLGVKFSLDDFGTGYSSLAYLKQLPVSQLKIDQGFVRTLTHEPENRPIIDGVVSLARAFGCQVIAEGVESVQHGLALLALGCVHGQGYGIARPMPAADVPQWVQGWPQQAGWGELRAA